MDLEPLAHGVRPTRRAEGLPVLPPYVRRDADGRVRSALAQAVPKGGLVVVLGEPFAGKTRTALEAVVDALPYVRVFVPAQGEDLRTLPAALRDHPEPCLLWLDDLDAHLGHGGLEPRLLAQLFGQRAVVVATLRESAYDACRDGPGGRVLDVAQVVELPREWSGDERRRAEEAGDPRLAEAARHSGAEGVAAYLAVGPLVWREWQRARRPDRHPRGYALVRAAVDLARCGLRGPLPQDLLLRVHEGYQAVTGMEREPVDEALAWAAEKRHGVLRMLRRGGARMWEPAAYLVDTAAQDEDFPPVARAVWRCALAAADADAAYDFETVAARAWQAFRPAAEAGDSSAMHHLALVAEGLGAQDEAEAWLRRAAEAGQAESAGRLGRRLAERGRTREAEPFLETAAEAGDEAAATLLGRLLLNRARRWLRAGAEAGDPEAAQPARPSPPGSGGADRAAAVAHSDPESPRTPTDTDHTPVWHGILEDLR
ncbi:hypothetical protein GCM10020295_49790 [Streptomyces cinereospinus]